MLRTNSVIKTLTPKTIGPGIVPIKRKKTFWTAVPTRRVWRSNDLWFGFEDWRLIIRITGLVFHSLTNKTKIICAVPEHTLREWWSMEHCSVLSTGRHNSIQIKPWRKITHTHTHTHTHSHTHNSQQTDCPSLIYTLAVKDTPQPHEDAVLGFPVTLKVDRIISWT